MKRNVASLRVAGCIWAFLLATAAAGVLGAGPATTPTTQEAATTAEVMPPVERRPGAIVVPATTAPTVVHLSDLGFLTDMKVIDDQTVQLHSASLGFQDLQRTHFIAFQDITIHVGQGFAMSRGGPPTGEDGPMNLRLILLRIDKTGVEFRRQSYWFGPEVYDDVIRVIRNDPN